MIPSGTKLVMIGDSITDCGRMRPVGEGKGESLGSGYVSQIQALLDSTYPKLNLRMVNMGVSANTVRELRERWQSDVIDLRPDWISVMIGINDILRHYNRRMLTESHVSLGEYEETLEKLVEEAKVSGVREILLMTPFFIESSPDDVLRQMSLTYGAAVKRIGERQGTRFVNIQSAFDRYLEHHYSLELAADRVHPSQTGHMIIAREWLQAVGYRWD
ncbi:SGNH/GDSL hydrolase family protein [Saccharibacillus qingshengii]|uniref:SGNH/GDSL hydrolase family protein n=1 Tax=Saccharibacillus qingshengii TaxID=1763540 RepID=UPI001551B0AE|nr:SGNH/GDSL hydrolase family protein [Saccharibacillus qingshengii]